MDVKSKCITSGLLALALAGRVSAPPPPYTPPSSHETIAERTARFDAWRAANPNIDARLHRIAMETQALVAARPAEADALDAPIEIFRVRDTGLSVWDCPLCPELVVTPAGRYTIGAPDSEPNRYTDEGPRRRIHLDNPLAVSRFEITRDQYQAFVTATNYPVAVGCQTDRDAHGVWANDTASTFRDPAYPQSGAHPVACVSWEDAQAYVAWLNTQTRSAYRLLTESEWEFLARAGAATIYPWGDDADAGCADMNGADVAMGEEYPGVYTDTDIVHCRDGALKTAAVGSYRPNPFGLYDLIGNLADWVEDCYAPSYAGLPANGAAQNQTPCAARVIRGGAWGSQRPHLRTADRFRYAPTQHDDSVGVRVARTLN